MSATATIAATTTEGVLLGARRRAGARFFYDGPATLYLLNGDGQASPTNYTARMGARWLGQWELPAGCYGPVRGVWSAPEGALVVADYD